MEKYRRDKLLGKGSYGERQRRPRARPPCAPSSAARASPPLRTALRAPARLYLPASPAALRRAHAVGCALDALPPPGTLCAGTQALRTW